VRAPALALLWLAGAAALAVPWPAALEGWSAGGGQPRGELLVVGLAALLGSPRGRVAREAAGTRGIGIAGAAFAPLVLLALALDQAARAPLGALEERAPWLAWSALLAGWLGFASARAGRSLRRALRHGIAWHALVALPTLAAWAGGSAARWTWSPLVWCAAGGHGTSAAGALAVAVVLTAVAVGPPEGAAEAARG